MLIKQEDLVFRRLDNGSGILNATITINEDIRLSISKSDDLSMWYAGSDGCYEVAVQAYNPAISPYADLIQLNDERDNVIHDCDMKRINQLAKKVKNMYISGIVEIPNEQADKDGKPWRLRFYFAGYAKRDRELKLSWCATCFCGRYRVVERARPGWAVRRGSNK